MTDPLSSSRAPFAVIGATGQQGSAVVDALLDAGEPVRALVRDPSAERSRALADRGVELVKADQEDAASLRSALTGVSAMYLMTTFGGDDATEGEVRRGRIAAEAAADAGVPRVVYSSVGGAERHTGIPHFESKRRVEERLFELVPTVIVRPAFFMENLSRSLDGHAGGPFVLRLPMPGDVPLQIVAVRDIGQVAAALLQDPTLITGDAIEIAGDEKTLDEVAARIGAQLDVAGRYEAVPVESLGDTDQETMFRWFVDTPAYDADFDATRRIDPGVLDLEGWLRARS